MSMSMSMSMRSVSSSSLTTLAGTGRRHHYSSQPISSKRISNSDSNSDGGEWDALATHHPLLFHTQNTIINNNSNNNNNNYYYNNNNNNNTVKIHLVGVNHLSYASLKRTKSAIEKLNPSVVALEIDRDKLDLFSYKSNQLKRPAALASLIGGSSHTLHNKTHHHHQGPALKEALGSHLQSLFGFKNDLTATSQVEIGLELSQAIQSAKLIQARIKAIDIAYPKLMQPIGHYYSRDDQDHAGRVPLSTYISHIKSKYNIPSPPGPTRSRLRGWIFNAIHRWSYGDTFEKDAGTIQDTKTSLRLWGAFYPWERYMIVELRDAIMVDHLSRLSRSILYTNEIRKKEYKELLNPVIVAVVGKSHVFGMAELWNRMLTGPKLRGKSNIKYHLLDDLVDRIPEFDTPLEMEKSVDYRKGVASMENRQLVDENKPIDHSKKRIEHKKPIEHEKPLENVRIKRAKSSFRYE